MLRGFKKLLRAITSPFRTHEPPRPESPQPPPPEIPGGGGLGGDEYSGEVPEGRNETELRDTWEYITGNSRYDPLFADYLEIYDDAGMAIEPDNAEYERLWDKFLRAFWLNSTEPGSVPRAEWYDDANIPRDMIDWSHWREVKKTA